MSDVRTKPARETREQERAREERWYKIWCRATAPTTPETAGEVISAHNLLVQTIAADGFDYRDVRLTARDTLLTYERMQEAERKALGPDPALTARITELEQELARKDVELLQARAGTTTAAKQPRSKATGSFRSMMGRLVNAARGEGGMTVADILATLNRFKAEWDGPITANMLYGIAVVGNPDMVLPENSDAPLTRPEVIAMHTKLWGVDNNNIRPMQQFAMTHIQEDISGYMHDDAVLARLNAEQCHKLRQRYWLELSVREKSRRYERMSRGLALLEKRTSKVARHTDDLLSDDVMTFAEEWFGEDARLCIGTLCGYDLKVGDNRKPPQELRKTVEIIRSLVEGCDLDDPNLETILAQRVKNHRTGQRLWSPASKINVAYMAILEAIILANGSATRQELERNIEKRCDINVQEEVAKNPGTWRHPIVPRLSDLANTAKYPEPLVHEDKDTKLCWLTEFGRRTYQRNLPIFAKECGGKWAPLVQERV